MACTSKFDTVNLSYDCNTAFGGLDSVKLYPYVNGVVDTKKSFEIEFNKYDGYTNYAETKTADLSGTVKCEQTLQIEIPLMQRMALTEKMSNPNMRFKIEMITRSGKKITMGQKFGAKVSADNAQSGASRDEKSVVQVTFFADEYSLAEIA